MSKDKNAIVTEAGRVIRRDPDLRVHLRSFLTDLGGPYRLGSTRFKSHYPLSKEVRLAFFRYQRERDLYTPQQLAVYTLNAHLLDTFTDLWIVKSAGTRIGGLIQNPDHTPGDTRPFFSIPHDRLQAMKLFHQKKIYSLEQLTTEYQVRPSELARIDSSYFLPEDYTPRAKRTRHTYMELDPELYYALKTWVDSESCPFRRATPDEVREVPLTHRLTRTDIRYAYEKEYGFVETTDEKFIAHIRALTDSEDFTGSHFQYYGLNRKD